MEQLFSQIAALPTELKVKWGIWAIWFGTTVMMTYRLIRAWLKSLRHSPLPSVPDEGGAQEREASVNRRRSI
jgi:hypothetical protein